jgi:flagellar hook-length control protein FliK
LGEIISSIARDRTDGIMPGLKLGHPLQSEKVADPAPAEKPAELSNARAVVFDPGKRQGLSTADAHDRAPTHREHQGWLHQPSDSPAIVGAQVPRGYEIQQDAEAAPKWRPTIERLADDIVSHARLGRKEAVLQLDPPELGKIKIDLRLEDGKLRAQIIAEGRESKQLIEAHLPELRQALAAGRLETAEVRVSQGNWSGLSGNFSQNFHHSPQGRQESGWSFHGTPAAEGERRPAGSASSPARGAGRISMWA